jgi:hypothetical protein
MHTCGSTNVTQKFEPQPVSSASPLIVGTLFAGLGVLSGVPLTLTSGTTLVIVTDMTLLPVAPDFSDIEVFGRSDDDMDCLGEGSGCPNVPPNVPIDEGGELGSGDRLPACATAIAVLNQERNLMLTGF